MRACPTKPTMIWSLVRGCPHDGVVGVTSYPNADHIGHGLPHVLTFRSSLWVIHDGARGSVKTPFIRSRMYSIDPLAAH